MPGEEVILGWIKGPIFELIARDNRCVIEDGPGGKISAKEGKDHERLTSINRQ
jgi:hypothetical protein